MAGGLALALVELLGAVVPRPGTPRRRVLVDLALALPAPAATFWVTRLEVPDPFATTRLLSPEGLEWEALERLPGVHGATSIAVTLVASSALLAFAFVRWRRRHGPPPSGSGIGE